MLKYRYYHSYAKIVNNIFINVQQPTKCGYGLTKMRRKGAHFFMEKKKVKKASNTVKTRTLSLSATANCFSGKYGHVSFPGSPARLWFCDVAFGMHYNLSIGSK